MRRTLVIIPHYGSDQLLVDLFGSVGIRLSSRDFHGDLSLIDHPACSFLIINNNRKNRGFTAACNLGLQRLCETPEAYSHAWLLNNDTVFESLGQFEKALGVLISLSDTCKWAIVGQQVRSAASPDAILFGGALECFPAGRHKSGLRSRGDWAAPSEERWLSFCSVLIRNDLVARIGLLDEAFATYYSDSDYCLRARLEGFGIGYSGQDSYVFHKIGQSSKPNEDQQRVLQQDLLAFWRKWIGSPLHATYMNLMGCSTTPGLPGGLSRSPTAGGLVEQARIHPELHAWLLTLPASQPLELKDILEHFQYQSPITPFSILCNVAREMLEHG